jgi:hypothetical protein
LSYDVGNTAPATLLVPPVAELVLVPVPEMYSFSQGDSEVISHITDSPLLKVELEYEALLLPTLLPFTFHWYCIGLPPLLTLAVNANGSPSQIMADDGLIVTVGGVLPKIFMITVLEVATAGLTQLRELVISQLT